MQLPRVCYEDGCGEIATTGTNRCPKHPQKRSPSSVATSRAGWKAIRLLVLRRDSYICHWCDGRASTVDHVEAVANGGTNDESNLVASCWPCNRKRSNHG